MGYNKIRDITPLAGLTRLYSLGLQHNNISDISVLETVTAGSEYDTLYLYNNYLNLTEGSKTMDTISVVKDRVPGWFVFSTQKPLAETPFDAKAQSKGIGRVELSWDYMPDTVYEVTRTGGGETKAIPVGSDSTSYIDTDVIPGTEYSYTVKAHIWVGDDADPVTVQKTVTVKADGRTLTDSSTGIRVSGDISEGAALAVEELTLGDSPADAAIRARMKDGGYVFIWGGNISLTGSFTGTLTLSLPVGEQYNGQTVVVMHAKQDGTLETYSAVVQDGYAMFEVTSLSPFAVFQQSMPDDIPKTGDGSVPWVWWLLAGISAAGIILLSCRKTKGII